jgi:hypothetical protein
VKLHPFFAELIGPPVDEPAPPPLVDWWRILAGAVVIAAIVVWAHFLVQPVRAEFLAVNLVAHVCHGDECRDHVEPMPGLYACQARARAIEELKPNAWSAKVECLVVRGMPDA